MGAFDRAKKIITLGRGGRSSNNGSGDFDFDDLDSMSNEFGDDHNVSTDRKSSIKSYVKNHYSSKLQDREEQKRLVKAALPSSYSGPIDLAMDLKDDLSSLRLEMSREWSKNNGAVKKTLKGFEKQLRFLKLNKLADYANSSSGGSSYQDQNLDPADALVASIMGDFPKGTGSKVIKEKQKQRKLEAESEIEYKTKSLETQMRGAVNSEAMVSELRRLTNYQDQITHIYHKKSLEVQIRSYSEHRIQTDILRAYKDESIAELKEIHKNTGLPEVVKINQQEFAANIFKQRMMGNVANWFDGKTANIRKRVVSQIRGKLLDMTKSFGSSLEGFLGMADVDGDQGGGLAKLLFGMGADAALDRPYNSVMGKITGKIRNKLSGNSKIAKWGRGARSVVSGMGSNVNHALITGESGNSVVDSLMDFFGLRQAAIQRNDKLRGSTSANLDTAAFMDVRFKQTVERVIPGLLTLIHKENYLLRTGQKDDKNFSPMVYDWKKESFVSRNEMKASVATRVFNRDRIIETASGYEDLLTAYGAMGLPSSAKEKLRNWLRKQITSSKSIAPIILYAERVSVFGKNDAAAFEAVANHFGHLDDIGEMFENPTAGTDAMLRAQGGAYAKWSEGIDRALSRMINTDPLDRAELQKLVDEGYGEFVEELGAAKREDDGSISINMEASDYLFKTYGRNNHKQRIHFKDGDTRRIKDRNGNWIDVTNTDIDEARSGDWESHIGDEYTLARNRANKNMNQWMNQDVLSNRNIEATKKGLESLLSDIGIMSTDEAKKRGLHNRWTRAAGGYIPSFAGGGGPTGDDLKVDDEIHVKMHGKEFVTDKETTEKNRKLLEFMNKFKAPVVMPDGSVNPIYYRAFGYKTEAAFKESATDTSLTREQNSFFNGIHKASGNKDNSAASKMIAELFTSIDLNKISDADLNTLTSGRTPNAKKFQLLLALRKKQGTKRKTKSDLFGSGVGKLRNLVEGTGREGESFNRAKDSVKNFFNKAKEDILKLSEIEADKLVTKALGTLDSDSLSDADMEVLTDPAVSSKDKAILIAKLSSGRTDKAQVIKRVFNTQLSKAKASAKKRVKDLINGGTDNTTNSDNLKAIAEVAKGKVTKGKNALMSRLDVIKALAEGGQLDEQAKSFANKILAKTRLNKVAGVGARLWRDNPVDVYVTDNLEHPRLNVFGFANGAYIDVNTGRVLATHHDITGQVVNNQGDVLLDITDFQKGLVDKEGNPIFINSLKRMRNEAKDKAKALYDKYAKKHVNNAVDKMLSITEKWQSMFKDTAINIYMGDGVEPRLTGAGFKEGKYLSFLKKKVLSGYLDIDGPVMAVDGTILITSEELQTTPMRDKDGNTIKPPKLMGNLERLGSLVWKAMSFDKAYNLGKKAFGKLKKGWNALRSKKEKEEGEEDLTTQPGKLYGRKLKDRLKRLAGYDTNEDGSKTLRVGSWQWKRAKKEEDGWMSKFGSLFGRKEKAEGGAKKSGMFMKMLGLVGSIAGGLFTMANKLGSIISGGVFKVAKWIVPMLGKNLFKGLGWIAKPILTSLAFIGQKVGGGALNAIRGRGLGGIAKVAGLAAGGYMMYKGLKGEEQLDENGQPVLDENGQAVTKTNWGSVAGGAATMALSTGRGLALAGRAAMAVGMGARIGLGLLSGPVGWAALGATAAWYTGKWLFGKYKKNQAAKENPILSFRMNQYGFDLTDEKTAQTLMQLESVLQPNVVFQQDKANFKSEIDVESVFGIFGLKYQGGDPEKNKVFLAWFLGRFKPVYLAHVKTMNAMKKTTDLTNVDKSLTATQRLDYLEKVHFKNQTDMNPYGIKASPFTDPDETNYDFDDMEDKYEDVKEILTELASKESNKSGEKGKEGEKKEEETSLLKKVGTAAVLATPVGGVVAGSLWALKKLSAGSSDIFKTTVSDMGKSVSSYLGTFMATVKQGWEQIKSLGSGLADSVSNGVGNVVNGINNVGADIGRDYANGGVGGVITGAYEKLTGKTGDMQKKVYEAFVKAGLTPNQAKAITAEVGRENGYNSSVIFGSHIDPAARGGKAVKNLGMISWNGSRGEALAKLLQQRGLMDGSGKMVNSQAALDTQAQFAVSEMKGAYASKLKHFWSNPNADPETFAEELGKKYVVWAYGQNDIASKGGGRVKFDWKKHDSKRKSFLAQLNKQVGGGSNIDASGIVGTTASAIMNKANVATAPVNASAGIMGAGNAIANSALGGVKKGLEMPTSKGGAAWDLDAAVTCLVRQAKGGGAKGGGGEKLGDCAKYVRKALNAGDLKKQIPGSLGHAYQFNASLPKVGWTQVSGAPQKGDIAVFDQNTYGKPGSGSRRFGHVCMFTGTDWISDFNQRTVYPNSSLAGKVNYKLWRATNAISNGKAVAVKGTYAEQDDNGKSMVDSTISASPSTDNVSYQDKSGNITSKPNGSSSPGISEVMDQGGFASTSNVSTAQKAGNNGFMETNNILRQSLSVQTEMRDAIIEIKNYIIKDGSSSEINQLKKRTSPEAIGQLVGEGVAAALTERFGLNTPMDKPKATPVISASK